MNNELRALLIQALQEETCGVPAAQQQTANTVQTATNATVTSEPGNTPIQAEATPTPETEASINYWPLVALAAFSYLFLTDGK